MSHILCRLRQRLFDLDLHCLDRYPLKNLCLSLAWTSCICTLAQKWIDGSKIKRPRNYRTEHLCVWNFQIHACCDHYFVFWHSNLNLILEVASLWIHVPGLIWRQNIEVLSLWLSCIIWWGMKCAHFSLRLQFVIGIVIHWLAFINYNVWVSIMTVLHNMTRYEVCTFFFKIAICLRDSDTLISVYKLHCES